MDRPILFEHIPKTGGITLRRILQKVYGQDQIFYINSKNPKISLDEFSMLSPKQRTHFKVVAGHGALMYKPFLENPFTVTILRSPIPMFFSQFYYLKRSKSDRFWDDVSRMQNPEEYLQYALDMGQDNLMTRFLSNSMQWIIDPKQQFQNMDMQGGELLIKAKENLKSFDAVIQLENFDAGIYALSQRLKWKNIPLFLPGNRTKIRHKEILQPKDLMDSLGSALRFDVSLYRFFLNQNLDISKSIAKNSTSLRLFQFRQAVVKNIAILLGKY